MLILHGCATIYKILRKFVDFKYLKPSEQKKTKGLTKNSTNFSVTMITSVLSDFYF